MKKCNLCNKEDKIHYRIKSINYKSWIFCCKQCWNIVSKEKGYTYGAGSFLRANSFQTPFYAYSQVRSNVTLESLDIFKNIINSYSESYNEEDLETTKNKLIKSNALRFERLGSMINMLDTMSKFNLGDAYILDEQEVLSSMKLDEAKSLAKKRLDGKKMYYVGKI